MTLKSRGYMFYKEKEISQHTYKMTTEPSPSGAHHISPSRVPSPRKKDGNVYQRIEELYYTNEKSRPSFPHSLFFMNFYYTQAPITPWTYGFVMLRPNVFGKGDFWQHGRVFL